MLDFFQTALPWIGMGLAITIVTADMSSRSKYERTRISSMDNTKN